MEGIEGHHGAVQVQGLQQCGEMAGLVVLDVDLEMIQEAPAVLGDAEEMTPGAISAAGAAGGLAVYPWPGRVREAACCVPPPVGLEVASPPGDQRGPGQHRHGGQRIAAGPAYGGTGDGE